MFIHSLNQSIIHSIRPTEHLLRDGESWLLPSGTSQDGGSGPKSTDVLVASAGLPGSLMIGRRWALLCGQCLGIHQPECSLLPISRPSAGRRPGIWTTPRTPGEWISGGPRLPLVSPGRLSQAARSRLLPSSALSRWEPRGSLLYPEAAVSPSVNRSSGSNIWKNKALFKV